jgi:hypothetical protein
VSGETHVFNLSSACECYNNLQAGFPPGDFEKSSAKGADIHCSLVSTRFVNIAVRLDGLTALDRMKLTMWLATFCISGTICMPDEPFPTTATRLPANSKPSIQFAEWHM